MLSWMATDFFAQSPMLLAPVAALGIFMVVFTGLTVRTLLTKPADLEAIARLPLDDEETTHE